MSNKSVYTIFAILFAVALISFYVSRMVLKNVSVSRVETKQEINSPDTAIEVLQLPTAAPVSAGITILGKQQEQQERNVESTVEEREVRRIEEKRNKQSASSSSTGRQEESSSGPTSGITKVQNRPTPEKVKELNSRGIIIY